MALMWLDIQDRFFFVYFVYTLNWNNQNMSNDIWRMPFLLIYQSIFVLKPYKLIKLELNKENNKKEFVPVDHMFSTPLRIVPNYSGVHGNHLKSKSHRTNRICGESVNE